MQFIWVCFQVVVAKNPISDQGSPIFLVNTFSMFFVLTIMMLFSLKHGADANYTHIQTKKILTQVLRENQFSRSAALDNLVYERDE